MLRYLVICVFHLTKDLLESMTKSVWTQPFTRAAAEHTRDARLCAAWTLPCNWSRYFHHPCRVNQGETTIPNFFFFFYPPAVTESLRLRSSFCLSATLISVSHHLSSFRAAEKWRIDWISVSLWETNLLMRRAELVPYSSASSCGHSGCQAHGGTSAPLQKSNGAQNELWMGIHFLSLSDLHQSVSASLPPSPFLSSLCGAASAPFLPAHVWPLYSATIVLSSSLLISQSVILQLFFRTVFLFILSRRERRLLWKSIRGQVLQPPPPSSWERGQSPGERVSLRVAEGWTVEIILLPITHHPVVQQTSSADAHAAGQETRWQPSFLQNPPENRRGERGRNHFTIKARCDRVWTSLVSVVFIRQPLKTCGRINNTERRKEHRILSCFWREGKGNNLHSYWLMNIQVTLILSNAKVCLLTWWTQQLRNCASYICVKKRWNYSLKFRQF